MDGTQKDAVAAMDWLRDNYECQVVVQKNRMNVRTRINGWHIQFLNPESYVAFMLTWWS